MDNDFSFPNKKMPSSNIPTIKILSPEEKTGNRISIFKRTKSNQKTGLKLFSKKYNSINSNNDPNLAITKKRSRLIHNFDDNYEEQVLKEIYKKNNDNSYIPKMVQKFFYIKDCSILKYGLKPSIDTIDFSFCRTCDPNLINPICIPCIKECHFGHKIQKNYLKGEIKCICGERLHCISKNPDLTINNLQCQLEEWFLVSKLNFFYNTKDNKNLCMLCYNFCNNDRSKKTITKLESSDKKDLPKCFCNNEEVHQERKNFFEKMEKIAHKLDHYEYFNLLHPSQIINMIFLSKKQFDVYYADLNFLNDILLSNDLKDAEFISFKKANFTSTNYFLIFKHLIEFIKLNKNTNISYYCQEAENYFSFKNVKLVLSLMNIMKYNEKSFWNFSSNFLQLFLKIYIGNKTQSFPKFKLSDLENFSSSLRWLIRNSNQQKFPESQEIIKFLLTTLTNININGFSVSEALDTIDIIISILKKMSIFNLQSNSDMIRIIHELEKILFAIQPLRKSMFKTNQGTILNAEKHNKDNERMSVLIQKNIDILYQKEIKLYYNIIKLIIHFNLCFNDRLIESVLLNNEKYPNLDSINKDSAIFSFFKSDFGRSLIRLTIITLYTIDKVYFKFSYGEKYKSIMNQGMKILSCYLIANDIYLLSLTQNLNITNFYKFGKILNEETDLEYINLSKEKNKLDECYKKFFIFENKIEDIIQEFTKSLSIILKENNTKGFSDKKNIYILKSNYYFILSKFLRILNFVYEKNEKLPKNLENNLKSNEENIDNLIDRIFLFYENFIYNSRENSLILMSEYIFKDLCKAPIKYGIKNFELFLKAIKFISNKSNIIGSTINYIQNLFSYLEFLRNKSYQQTNECLLIFLKIIELLVLNIKCLNPLECIEVIKSIIIQINEIYKIDEYFFSSIKNEKNDFEKIIYYFIKIINDIFDFTNEEEKNKALFIFNPQKIINALKSYDLELNLRTEFLKYIRKIYIELNFDENEKSNHIYANSIISIDDNLSLLKTNPLITNFRYPTKFLSYFKDFLNLSVHSEILRNPEIISNEDNKPIQNYTFQFDNLNRNGEVESSISNINKENNLEKKDDESLYEEKSEFSSETQNNKNTFLKPCFDEKIYELLMNELLNKREITKDLKTENDEEIEMLRNYFENGLLLTIIYFLKRSFPFSHCFTGKEIIKLSELIKQSCKLRLFIAEYKYDFWNEILDIKTNNKISNKNSNEKILSILIKEEGKFCILYNNRSSLINGSFCINNNINHSTINSLNLIKEKKFLCYDYTTLYDIFEENILSLLKERKVNKFSECFMEEGKDISLKNIIKIENKLLPENQSLNEIDRRIMRLFLLYKNGKNIILNENNSSLFSILPEICIEYETNYRNLLITILINFCIKNNNTSSLYFLYKLLSLQTSETQNNLINLIGGYDINESDLGFMEQFSQILFKRIIFLFIEAFNPADKLLDNNFVCSYLLIKIFKLLCEEHNNFFQCRLVKYLQYKYEEIIPMFYNESQRRIESLDKSNGENNSEAKIEFLKGIKFFEFFLHVLLKIILISDWDKLDLYKEDYHRENPYLYDIFEAILEMLNEIIQGNRPQYLNTLGNTIIDGKIKLENLIDDGEYYLNRSFGLVKATQIEEVQDINTEKIDHLRYFVKNVTNFIFSDKNSLILLYKIRNNLMLFFTTILEEKNCNEEIQKFIIKYLNISRVFNSIGCILKSYYLRESQNEDIEMLLKSLKEDISNNVEKTIIDKKTVNSQILIKDTYNNANTFGSNNIERSNTRVNLDISTRFFPKIKKKFIRTMRQKEKNIIFNENLLQYYSNLYFTMKDFNQTYEFKLSNAFYKYIKLITVLNKSDEAKHLIELAESISEEGAKRKFNYNNIIKKHDFFHDNIKFKESRTIKKLSSKNFGSINTKKALKYKNILSKSNLDNSELFELNIKKPKIEESKINSIPLKPYNRNIRKKKKDKKLYDLIKENKNEYNKESIEHYYIIKFFESITTTVEVRTSGSINQTVIFTQPPEMIYLSNGTKSEFEREVNRDSETSKKNYLVRNVKYFQKEIKFYQMNQSKLSRWVSKIDFLYIQILSYIYALLFNLFILFSLNGDTNISIENDEDGSIQSRRTKSNKIQSLIDGSIYKWGNSYNIICYLYAVLNGIFIFVWIYFRMPLYYKIDRLKYMEENNIPNKNNLGLFQKIYIISVMTIYNRDYISTLIYEFIFSIIGTIMKRGEIIYAFLLLPIIDLNNILKNIIVSIKLQYNEVGLTFFFAAMIIYSFSNLAYFFFKHDFSQEIEYKEDNVCDSLIFCFLNALDSGLRARGGIGDSAIRISYSQHKKHYILRLILDDSFFLLIVITAIDLVFGIILGAFSTLRNEEQKHLNDRKNHCFICHVNKNTLEKNRQNFNEHRSKIHNLWNYVDYMITLKFSDVHELNAINSYANNKIENNDISWLPTYKDLKNIEKTNYELEEDIKIEEENVNKYYIKNS